jgi:hypothetical protein
MKFGFDRDYVCPQRTMHSKHTSIHNYGNNHQETTQMMRYYTNIGSHFNILLKANKQTNKHFIVSNNDLISTLFQSVLATPISNSLYKLPKYAIYHFVIARKILRHYFYVNQLQSDKLPLHNGVKELRVR